MEVIKILKHINNIIIIYMSAVIDNDYQTNLLFKRFTGVAATQLDQEFSNEPFRAIQNIFSRDILIEEVPSQAPISIFNLDNSNNWQDSSGANASLDASGQRFSDLYPNSNLEFYKNVELEAVPGANSRVWRILDASGNNILQDTLNFKFDDINSTYLMRVKYSNGTVYINNPINSYPLFWVLDNQSGYLQLYQTSSNLSSIAHIPTSPPKISFFRYIGKKGLLNLDISGQQQVLDLSGLSLDTSNILVNLERLNRMILPDGYVDISGTNYDLCGNEVVRTNYTYNRKNMFIGYENLPILDGSAVNHLEDPSLNGIRFILDVSGNVHIHGKKQHGFFDPPNITAWQGASGEHSHAEGYRTWVGGDYAHVEGNACKIGPHFSNSGVGHYSHAEGDSNEIYTLFSHAEGRSNVIQSASNWSHIEGRDNLIDSNSSYVHVEGRNNIVSSNSLYSHVEGSGNNIISAISSHAEGVNNTIRGSFCHAEGYNNTIDTSAVYSHIEGGFNQIGPSGAYAHAEGFHTIIDTSGGHATGHYNDISQNVIFVIGCGKSDISRMDALYVDMSCTTHINNRLEVSGNVLIDGELDMSCNFIENIEYIKFCNDIIGVTDLSTAAVNLGFSAFGVGTGFGIAGNHNISIGNFSNHLQQNEDYTISIGYETGHILQKEGAIAIGKKAGKTHQRGKSIAIGYEAGSENQGQNSSIFPSITEDAIAIGNQAGKINQKRAIAFGSFAGYENQEYNSIAIGIFAGNKDQSDNAISIGTSAGQNQQKSDAIAIGTNSGENNQEKNCIAIGKNAGKGNPMGQGQHENSIILNATGAQVDSDVSNALYIAPIRGPIEKTNVLFYDNSNNEITYGIINVSSNISGDLELSCNNILDVSSITFCDGTYIGPGSSFDISTSQTLDIISNKTIIKNDLGIRQTNPTETLDVTGSTFITENIFISSDKSHSTHTNDNSIHARNTNLIDSLRLSFEDIFDGIWVPMMKANGSGNYTNFSTGQQYILSQPNPGKPNAVPTFSSAWGPCVIPIAYLDINQNYQTTPFDPAGTHGPNRPHIANTSAYFTVKFSQLYDSGYNNPVPVNWDQVTNNVTNTGKSGLAAITHQSITFVAGYTDNFKRLPGDDFRRPKPFIKVISTNIPNLKNLIGLTSDGVSTAIDINVSTNGGLYYGHTPNTPKIGGIVRIIIAESCPGIPADKEIRNKVWLLLEHQWNYEAWQGAVATNNSVFLRSLLQDHAVDVRMYSNNHGHLNNIRTNPFTNNFNTDWQLITPKQILEHQQYSWDKFVLPMGNFASPVVFNNPTIVPNTDVAYTLMVGGTECPNPLTGILDGVYPPIVPGANLWEIWLNLKDWGYGITTTEEVFENNVDICGNVVIDGSTTAQTISATNITCNNLDALNSIDVGANQKLTFTENKIVSTVTATGWAPIVPSAPGLQFNPGLEFKAENFYFDCTSIDTTRGFVVSLARADGDSIFRIVDNSNNSDLAYGGHTLFQVEGSGLVQTKSIHPWTDMCYNIGISTFRYKNLYVGNIDASGDVNIAGNINVDGNFGDISATNIDVSNNLNVDGLITGVAETTFVEYRDYITDISFDISGWYCIARTKDTNNTGGQDNARGLFILDDDTSGKRQQIIFYAGTSYSRGNYINILANNWYGTPTITNIKMDISSTYYGTNIYIYREATTSADDIHVRLYENGREFGTGGKWELTATPIAGLTTTDINLDITYNPNSKRANSISSLDTYITGEFTAPTIKNTDFSGINMTLGNTSTHGIFEIKDANQSGLGAHTVYRTDGHANTVTHGGYEYTSSSNPITFPTIGGRNPINRVVFDLNEGHTQHSNLVADSGSVLKTQGGIKIMPLQTGIGGAQGPGWGASLFLGEWGWGNQNWNNHTTIKRSQSTNDHNRPGSGNVYCNAVRQNIVHTNQNNQGPVWNHGFQGYSANTMYYNGGDIRYIIVDPKNGSNHFASVTLPSIQKPMLGQTITVARVNVPPTYINHKTAVLIKADTPDRINCPHSIFVDDNAFGAIALDPYDDLSGNTAIGFPNPYKSTNICSVTLVASQNGHYTDPPSSSGDPQGGDITTQFVWQFISSGSPGV
tara:strand:- start:5981 stop:12223 length:6243 start_codon:yes stop_codon:yes gene_type:complete